MNGRVRIARLRSLPPLFIDRGLVRGTPALRSTREARAPPALEQQIEDAEGALPVLGLRVLQVRIEDLEGAGEGHAQPAHEFGQAGFGFVAIGESSGGRAVRRSRMGFSSIVWSMVLKA